MKFISLVDTKNQNIITINADSFILRLERDGTQQEIRLKPYMASVLYELFKKHPNPLSYENVIEILNRHHLNTNDLTRLHRKLSETRKALSKYHPTLTDIILNTRGIGYSIPLRLKNLNTLNKSHTKFKNHEINKAIGILHSLITDAISMTKQGKIVPHSKGYIINRDLFRQSIVEKLTAFNECKKIMQKEIRAHEADFTALRIEYILAKGLDTQGANGNSISPLSYAISKHKEGTIRKLLGIELNSPITPLIDAITKQDYKLPTELVTNGATVNPPETSPYTPLGQAIIMPESEEKTNKSSLLRYVVQF